MTTPRGFLKSITTALMRLARNGDVDGLRSYLRSDDFLLHPDGWRWGRNEKYRWREQGRGHGYYRGGSWVTIR
jgi:hypothetical protein